MIGAELEFEGFDARSWTQLLALFAPGVRARVLEGGATSDDPEAPAGIADAPARGSLVIVVDEQGRVLKALHTTLGRVLGLRYRGPRDLPALCGQYAARRAVALREGALEEAGERLARAVGPEQDYLTQTLLLLRIMRDLIESGWIHMWPRRAQDVPVPSAATLRRALDLVFPDEHALLLYLWDGPATRTAVALRRRRGSIDLVAGPDLIAKWAGPLGGDWRRDYRVIADAVSAHAAPVFAGLFTQARTLEELLRNPGPGSWTKAVAVRDIIVHPAPPYVAAALGADAMHAVASASARFLGGIEALKSLDPVRNYVRTRFDDLATVTATLGFNPLQVLARLLEDPQPPDVTRSEPPSPSSSQRPPGARSQGSRAPGARPPERGSQSRPKELAELHNFDADGLDAEGAGKRKPPKDA